MKMQDIKTLITSGTNILAFGRYQPKISYAIPINQNRTSWTKKHVYTL